MTDRYSDIAAYLLRVSLGPSSHVDEKPVCGGKQSTLKAYGLVRYGIHGNLDKVFVCTGSEPDWHWL